MELQQQAQLPKTALSSELPNTAPPSLTLHVCTEKIYHGVRHGDGNCEVFVDEPSASTPLRGAATPSRPLPLHLELRNHSPTGFAWGYGGSGPAQLALAILMDATGEQTLALRHYHEFKLYTARGINIIMPHPVLCRIGVRYAFKRSVWTDSGAV